MFLAPIFRGSARQFSSKDETGGVAGIKGGYTWSGWPGSPSNANPSKSVSGDFAVLPSLDYEFFWTGYKYDGQGSFDGTGTKLTANLNSYVFSIDPTIKFQVGIFRPYVGLGIGGAYINLDKGVASAKGVGATDLVGSASDFCFALQGLIGTEVFVAKHWSLSFDYKYLDFISPTFNSQQGSDVIPLHYHSSSIGQSIVTAGVNYYF